MSQPAVSASEHAFIQTASNFERELGLFFSTVAGLGDEVGEKRKQHLLSALGAIVSTFEAMQALNCGRPCPDRLTCPLSVEGQEVYRVRFQLGDEQWRRVEAFFDELSHLVGEELTVYLQRELGLPCAGCPVDFPLAPLPAA
jgi:hypothetical protein